MRMHDANNTPDGWRLAHLGGVASLRNKQVKPVGVDPSIYVALEHIVSGGSLNGYGRADHSVSNKTIFYKGDILYGKLRPNLRKVIRARFDGLCSTEILALSARDMNDGSFLGHLIKSDQLHAYAMQGITGTKMPRTSWSHLKTFLFLLPPLSEQRAIAAVLDSIDEAIERTEAVIAATERLRDSLLHELLTRGVPGWHSEWKDVPGVGTIPADWKVVRLGEIYEVQLGKMLSPKARQGKNPQPYLTNRNVRWGEFDLSDLPRMDFDHREIEKFQLRPGDLLVCEGGDTGRAAVWLSEIAHCYYQKALHRLRPIFGDAVSEFMLAVLMLYAGRGILLEHSERTSISHLTRERLLRMRIPHPSRAEQDEIVAVLGCVADSVGWAREERDRILTLKASVADALLRGSVRVPVEVRP